jgi:hypothetical protein
MKKTVKIFLFMPGLILALLLFSCENSNNEKLLEEPDLYQIGEFTDNGLTVGAYSDIPLFVGYNILYLEVHKDGEKLNNLDIKMMPLMHMEAHSHSSPLEGPGYLRHGEYDLFRSAIVFTMPSVMMGTWELEITIRERNQEEVIAQGVIDLDVGDSDRVITFMTEDESRYVLTWVKPDDPQTGSNDLLVTLHQRETMMSFPPVTDAIIAFEPWMPSMDHGSSNNSDPVHENDGHYRGIVNFNMTGDWELRFEISRNGDDLGYHVFELEF